MPEEVSKQAVLDIWLKHHGPIDEIWYPQFLRNSDLDYICKNFNLEQITECLEKWKFLEDIRAFLEIKYGTQVFGNSGESVWKGRPYSSPISARPFNEK